jgi:hypothetical protein
MTDRKRAVIAILAAIPALLMACSAWVQAQAKATEAKAAWAGYGDYVTDQLRRDEALLAALRDCQEQLHPKSWHDLAAGPVAAKRVPDYVEEPQAQEILDGLARSRGWEPSGGAR